MTKDYEREKFFLLAIIQEYTSSILFLDTIPNRSSLLSLYEMILDIKSVKFLSILLFYSINRTWNKIRYYREFTYLFLPYLVDKAELIIHNLLLYLRHKYGDKVLLYFVEEAKAEAKEDRWDKTTNRVVCIMDAFLEENIWDNIDLEDK